MFNILTDVDETKLVEYIDSSSKSTVSDDEDEIDNVPAFLVSDVYSESEQEVLLVH